MIELPMRAEESSSVIPALSSYVWNLELEYGGQNEQQRERTYGYRQDFF
jgi:hypothetical protein